MNLLYLPMNDEQLLECVCEGDDLAFAEFYRRWHGKLQRLLRWWLPDHRMSRDLADEILQETFLDAAHVAEPIECAGNWLHGLMWRQTDRIRKRERRRVA